MITATDANGKEGKEYFDFRMEENTTDGSKTVVTVMWKKNQSKDVVPGNPNTYKDKIDSDTFYQKYVEDLREDADKVA